MDTDITAQSEFLHDIASRMAAASIRKQPCPKASPRMEEGLGSRLFLGKGME